MLSLSALRSNLEKNPISMESPPCCQLLNRESSKKAPLVCHIYGIKCLAWNHMWWTRCAWESLYPQFSLSLDEWELKMVCAVYGLIVWSVLHACMHWCWFCCLVPMWNSENRLELEKLVSLAHRSLAFASFGACIKLSLVQIRSKIHPSCLQILCSARDPLTMQKDPSQGTTLVNKSSCEKIISLLTNICLTSCDFAQRQAL